MSNRLLGESWADGGQSLLQTGSKQSYCFCLAITAWTLLVARNPLEMDLCPWLSLG